MIEQIRLVHGYWTADITLPGDDHATHYTLYDCEGQPIRGRTNAQAAQDAAEALVRKILHRPATTPDKTTVAELCDAWRDYCRIYYRANGKPTSAATNAILGVQMFRHLYSSRRVAELRHADMLVLRDALVRSGVARTTINRRLWIVKSMLAWGLDESLITATAKAELSQGRPIKRGRTAAKEMPPVRPVDDDCIRAALPKMQPNLADMVRVHRLTGMRPVELCALRWSLIDRTRTPWVYTPPAEANKNAWRGEMGKPRAICIGPRARAILARYADGNDTPFSPLRNMAQWLAARHAARKTPTYGVRKSQRPPRVVGEAWTTSAYTKSIRRACKRAGVPPWGANRLRHAFATLVRREYGLDAARAVLGHTGGAGATDIYSYDAIADNMVAIAAPAVEALG